MTNYDKTISSLNFWIHPAPEECTFKSIDSPLTVASGHELALILWLRGLWFSNFLF